MTQQVSQSWLNALNNLRRAQWIVRWISGGGTPDYPAANLLDRRNEDDLRRDLRLHLERNVAREWLAQQNRLRRRETIYFGAAIEPMTQKPLHMEVAPTIAINEFLQRIAPDYRLCGTLGGEVRLLPAARG